MKNFKIYGFFNNNKILITNSDIISPASTFEENMSIQNHMKSTLSFKIIDTLPDGQANPFMRLVYPGAKIQVALEDYSKNYDFIIDSISSEFSSNIITYSVSAQDYASMVYAKEGQGLTISALGYYTGTLKELVYQILYTSRKNLGYKNLNNNYLNFLSYIDYSNVSFSNDIASSSLFIDTSEAVESYITFPRGKDLPLYDYNLSFNILEIPTSGVTIGITQLDANGSYITEDSYDTILDTGLVTLFFTPRSSMSSLKITFSILDAGILSIYDWKLKLDEEQFQDIINSNLRLSPNFIEDNFKGELGDISYYKKVTLSLSNSNLYNALVELATLFDADLEFDYDNKYVNFINKELEYKYKGFKLSPNFNLSKLSRSENYSEFLSAINIIGNENVYSIYPVIPSEFKQYFSDCIENDFTGLNYFSDFNTTTYSDAATFIKNNYIAETDDTYIRSKLIDNFAIAADKVPNFENRMYSLDYFYNTNKITEDQYNSFNSIVNNDLRKTNIKLRMYSDQYYNMASSLSTKESEIDFLCKNITVELINIDNINEKILEVEEYSSEWLNYINGINASLEQIDIYREELLKAYNIVFDILTLEPLYLEHEIINGYLTLTTDSYTNLVLNIYGYYNIYYNGIKNKIDEVKNQIISSANAKDAYQERLDYLNLQLQDETITSYRKTEFEVEASGLESQIKAMRYVIGDYEDDPFDPTLKGQYQNQLAYLELVQSFLGNYVYRNSIIDYSTWRESQSLDITQYWDYTGNASVVLEGNKDYDSIAQEDLMIKLEYNLDTAAEAIVTTVNDLEIGKQYRASGLIKVPAGVGGTFTISNDIVDDPSMEISLGSGTINDRWIGFEFYLNGAGSNAYIFPEYAEFTPADINVTVGTIDVTQVYNFTYRFDGENGNSIYLYRPRVDEVSDTMYSIEDIYNLFDNPLMINYSEDFSAEFDSITGLYDLLYNTEYPGNINVEKNNIITNLYKDYERFLIEGYYENSDEINSEGLLEQALLAFETIKYPRIEYNVSIIDLSDLDDFKYLKLRVGDKILISETEDRLYKSYQTEFTKYLQISEISYDLRNMDDTKLKVAQDDETIKILQYILKATQ